MEGERLLTTCQQCGDEFDGDEVLCADCLDTEPREPEEGDITTEDYRKFYQYGRIYLQVGRDADWRKSVNRQMKKDGFFPNVWFISDHGNAHLMILEDDNE